jgi:hypothetical protein
MKTEQALALRPKRFAVKDDFVVRVTVDRAADCRPAAVEAELLDLSPGGAKLALPSPLRFHEPVQLALSSEQFDLHLTVSATVRWIKPAKGDMWLAGCKFQPEIPFKSLEQLFSRGFLERRQHARESIRGEALARWELSAADVPVGMLDLSAGGFSFLSPLPAANGSHVRLSFESAAGQPVTLAAAIQWQVQAEGSYMVGCAFINNQSYRLLRDRFCPEMPARPRPPRSRLVLLSLATLAAAASCLWLSQS